MQESWSGLPFPPPGDLPNPGINPPSPYLLHCRQILYHWVTTEVPTADKKRYILILCVLVTQLCPTLCDPMNYSPLGSSVHEILQARILEWVTISFSRGSSRPKDWMQVSCNAGRFFTIWANRGAQKNKNLSMSVTGILEWVAMPSLRGSSQPRDQTQVSRTAGRFFTIRATSILGKPKNTGVGSLSLLQGIFPTQKSNQALLHCLQILYQLSYYEEDCCTRALLFLMKAIKP